MPLTLFTLLAFHPFTLLALYSFLFFTRHPFTLLALYSSTLFIEFIVAFHLFALLASVSRNSDCVDNHQKHGYHDETKDCLLPID